MTQRTTHRMPRINKVQAKPECIYYLPPNTKHNAEFNALLKGLARTCTSVYTFCNLWVEIICPYIYNRFYANFNTAMPIKNRHYPWTSLVESLESGYSMPLLFGVYSRFSEANRIKSNTCSHVTACSGCPYSKVGAASTVNMCPFSYRKTLRITATGPTWLHFSQLLLVRPKNVYNLQSEFPCIKILHLMEITTIT
jgi:hypothetical protein